MKLNDVRFALAGSGSLRAAINLGNPVLAQRKADGKLSGISVELASAIALIDEVIEKMKVSGGLASALKQSGHSPAMLY